MYFCFSRSFHSSLCQLSFAVTRSITENHLWCLECSATNTVLFHYTATHQVTLWCMCLKLVVIINGMYTHFPSSGHITPPYLCFCTTGRQSLSGTAWRDYRQPAVSQHNILAKFEMALLKCRATAARLCTKYTSSLRQQLVQRGVTVQIGHAGIGLANICSA